MLGQSSMFEGTEPGGVLAPDPGPDGPRRALVMAGGGLKVAFQAGVLQVWLDEARAGGRALEFRHADGASGGVYNLAMWCQGMTGRQIADNWRRFAPVQHGLAVNWRGWLRGASLLSMSRFRRRTLREGWRLDWERIQASGRSAGFNLFDVHEQQLVTLPPAAMTEDHLVAATSLPGWFPAVPIRGRNHIDGVFVTDANLDAAIAAGADELWLVWTVSTRGRWRGGPVAQYFQVIEACANGRLRRDLDRIARSNAAHAQGRPAEYPHPVRVRVLREEVPMHYLFTFTRATVAAAVERGVAAARQWCRDEGFDVDEQASDDAASTATTVDTAGSAGSGVDRADDEVDGRSGRRGAGGRTGLVRFRERLAGPVALGPARAAVAAEVGEVRGDLMTLRLGVEVDDLRAFLADDRHTARVAGWMECPLLGGTRPIVDGTVALLPESAPGRGSTMEYRLSTSDRTGRPLRVVGTKAVAARPGSSPWTDTTTLDVHVLRDDDPDAAPVLGGRLEIGVPGVVRLLGSLRGSGGPGFLVFFWRRLVRLYLRERSTAPPEPGPVELPGWPPAERPRGARVFVHNERVVPGPPRRAWEALVAAGSWSSFYGNAHFLRVAGSAQGRLGPGAVFRWVTFGLPITCTVTAYDEAAGRLGWTWRGPGARGHHLWSLSPTPEGTRVVTQETQRGLLPGLAAPLLRRVMHTGHAAWLRGIGRVVSRH
ncbi:patatin-like phospholipase family protein [Pseudonocardia humida]|uniref:SRPBCC family protein n=1 Tax=Pseudonocardia humida TaxID=2800819 RepID=A0ABT1A657_9PSEU|nr:patatin-like phospholipase family protein [Pseudonocardia humida]MCO1658416.1 SRPBCC family protein [Pseudonocardia humida]